MFGASWTTILFQIINFLILLLVLDRFFYRPALIAIDERKKRIEQDFRAADQAKEDGKKATDDMRSQLDELKLQVERERDQAARKVAETRRELEKKLDEEIEKRKETVEQELSNRREEAVRSIEKDLGNIVMDGLKAVFLELRGPSLEKAFHESFIERLSDPEIKNKLSPSTGEIELLSAGELPEAERKSVNDRIQQLFENPISLKYRTSPDLLAGFQLRTPSLTIDWNLKGWMKGVQEAYRRGLEKKK